LRIYTSHSHTQSISPHFCLTHFLTHREAIDKITEDLLEKETITGDEMRTILAKYTTIPEENLQAAREQEELKEAVTA
jgi:cell division protease FtsH